MAAERASPARVRSPGRTRSPQLSGLSGLSGRVDARQRLEGIGRLGTLPRPGSPGAARSVTPESRAASGTKSPPSRSPSPSSEPARSQPQALPLPLPTAEASPAAPDLAQLQARRRARARAPLGGAGVESVSGVSALVAQARGRDGDGSISEPTGQPAAGEHAETPAWSGPTNWELLGGSRRSSPMTMRGRVTPQLLGLESGTRTRFALAQSSESPWVQNLRCLRLCVLQASSPNPIYRRRGHPTEEAENSGPRARRSTGPRRTSSASLRKGSTGCRVRSERGTTGRGYGGRAGALASRPAEMRKSALRRPRCSPPGLAS